VGRSHRQRRTSAAILRAQCPGRTNERLQRHHQKPGSRHRRPSMILSRERIAQPSTRGHISNTLQKLSPVRYSTCFETQERCASKSGVLLGCAVKPDVFQLHSLDYSAFDANSHKACPAQGTISPAAIQSISSCAPSCRVRNFTGIAPGRERTCPLGNWPFRNLPRPLLAEAIR